MYLVTLKRLSVALARGYVPYLDTAGLAILWKYDDESHVSQLADIINAMFTIYRDTNHIDEAYFTSLLPYLPSVLVFVKEVNGSRKVMHWLFLSILPKKVTSNATVINEKSYKTLAGPLARISETVKSHAESNNALLSVSVEVYNPLIYQGFAPVKKSAISGLSVLKVYVTDMFGNESKVSEVTPEHMIALVSEHMFAPKITYLGNIKPKRQVDDIYQPTMSDVEIAHEVQRRTDVIVRNLPGVSDDELQKSDVNLFATINPKGSLASHYAFVVGDLVQLDTIIPSEKSPSSRKKGIYIVQ
jgi:hypothetical protein